MMIWDRVVIFDVVAEVWRDLKGINVKVAPLGAKYLDRRYVVTGGRPPDLLGSQLSPFRNEDIPTCYNF